jgi:hypothetical protein
MLGAALAAGGNADEQNMRDRHSCCSTACWPPPGWTASRRWWCPLQGGWTPPASRLRMTSPRYKNRLFAEFNSLVHLGKPSSTFVDVRDRATAAAEAAAAEADLEAAGCADSGWLGDLLVMDDDGTDDFLLGGGMSSPPPPAGGYAQVQAPGGMDLLGSDFAPSPAPPPPPTPQPPPQPQPVPVAVASPARRRPSAWLPDPWSWTLLATIFQAHSAAWPAAPAGASSCWSLQASRRCGVARGGSDAAHGGGVHRDDGEWGQRRRSEVVLLRLWRAGRLRSWRSCSVESAAAGTADITTIDGRAADERGVCGQLAPRSCSTTPSPLRCSCEDCAIGWDSLCVCPATTAPLHYCVCPPFPCPRPKATPPAAPRTVCVACCPPRQPPCAWRHARLFLRQAPLVGAAAPLLRLSCVLRQLPPATPAPAPASSSSSSSRREVGVVRVGRNL